jgi:hypothetical protein
MPVGMFFCFLVTIINSMLNFIGELVLFFFSFGKRKEESLLYNISLFIIFNLKIEH